MSLPELVVFSVRDSNEVRYLSFTGPQRQLRFGLDGVFSDIGRFVVESAGNGLVHIRSSYENNYWARASRDEPWLVASNPEKVDDLTNDESTLFRPRLSAGNVFVEFVHPQSGMNVVMRPANDAHAYHLCLEHSTPTQFSVIDFAALSKTRLPRYITFLGDNNKYLSTRKVNENSGFLHFSQYESPTNREVGFEVLYNRNGDNFSVKPMSMNGFWGVVAPDRRVVISPFPELDPGTLFDTALSSPPNTTEPGIALRSLFFNQYCHRSPQSNNLEVAVGSNTPHNRNAWLRLMAPGLYRVTIESFRHAWRGPTSSRVLSTVQLANGTMGEIERIETVVVTELITHTFSNSTSSLVRGGSAVFNGRIPNVGSDGELEFPNGAILVSADWGSSNSSESTMKKDVPIKVPPMSRVNATLSVHKATYEVPFSYQQIDMFPFGSMEAQHLHDGVFKIESDYGIAISYDIQPFTSEGIIINATEDGSIKPNASDEGINAQDDPWDRTKCI